MRGALEGLLAVMGEGQSSRSDVASEPTEAELLALFSSLAPSSHEPIEVIETHAARVFLVGSKAYKIKKHVKLPFLDFSSLEERKRTLMRELDLNRVHAPEIYIGVTAISRAKDGTFVFGEDGPIIDYALVMRRFEQSSLLARVAESGPLQSHLCRALAGMASAYHRTAGIARDAGGAAIMQTTLAPLIDEVSGGQAVFGQETITEFRNRSSAALNSISGLLEARGRSDHIRRCHGDLHLGNIVLLQGRPVPFDALEFDERLATIDVLYDLAFLIMDLDVRGDRKAANLVLNGYVGAEATGGEIEGLATLPLFLGIRAAIRAVVAMERGRQLPADAASAQLQLARRYLSFANAYLVPPKPCLVATGGLSGTGKSTLAALLASALGPAPGALHLRSDVERKRYFGVAETERLPPESYTQESVDRVYHILFDKAERALKAGHAVIIDAVAARPSERAEIEAIAAKAGVRFQGLWLDCPLSKLLERVEARSGDASDADAAVVKAQSRYDLGEMTWTVVNADRPLSDIHEAAEAELRTTGLICDVRI